MLADTDIEVLLNLTTAPGQVVIAPTLRSIIARQVDYTIVVHKTGKGGTSNVTQAGRAVMVADKPIALAHTSLGFQENDACNLTLILKENAVEVFRHEYSCIPDKQ